MEKRTYADRFKVSSAPWIMAGFTNEESPWNEDKATVAAGLAWGERKAELLKWVRHQMRRRLTVKQRRCIELHYFKGLTYAEVGNQLGCSASSACRSVQRGIARLRVAARVDPPKGGCPRL